MRNDPEPKDVLEAVKPLAPLFPRAGREEPGSIPVLELADGEAGARGRPRQSADGRRVPAFGAAGFHLDNYTEKSIFVSMTANGRARERRVGGRLVPVTTV